MKIDPKIEITEDGTHTLRHPVLGDLYHSQNGAQTESTHVFILNGLGRCEKQHIKILEVGFGSGLNALLTMEAAAEQGRTVEYEAVELYPISEETAALTCYASRHGFMTLHEALWEKHCQISPCFSLKKRCADLIKTTFDTTFDIVYFDAFAPDTQPHLWSPKLFSRIYDHMNAGAALVTYSAKGDVKRALREAGFEVSRLTGAPGKRHMVRAVKPGEME